MKNNKTIPTTIQEMTDKQKSLIDDCKIDIYNGLPVDLRRQIGGYNIEYKFSFDIKNHIASNGGDIIHYHTYNYKIEFSHSKVKADMPCIANYHIVATSSDDDYLKDEITHIKQQPITYHFGRYFGGKIRKVFNEINRWMDGQGHEYMTKTVIECTSSIVEGN